MNRFVKENPGVMNRDFYFCSMAKARHSASLYIKGITTVKDGVYELTEYGIIYNLTYEQFNLLKISRCHTVLDWYDSLDRFAKQEIKRSGDLPNVDNGFWPDE